MIADQKDFITPHITDSHTLDYPCLHPGFVCEYELPRWSPIHIGRFALDISPTRHVVMLWIAAALCIATTLLALRAHNRRTREGKAPSTQAGEFVREEMDHIREGKHGARSTKQAIAIGLSKARRAGVDLPPPQKGETSARTRQQATRDRAKGKRSAARKKPASPARSRATRRALQHEGKAAASPRQRPGQGRS